MFSCVHNRYYYFNSYHYYIYCIICAVVVSLYPVCLAFCEIKKRSRPMQVCSSRSSITGFGFVGFVSGCLYWFSFLVLFLFHSIFFLLLLCACFLFFRCYLFIYCARASVPARMLVACARAHVRDTLCACAHDWCWCCVFLLFIIYYFCLCAAYKARSGM